jgi:hypothetical protein
MKRVIESNLQYDEKALALLQRDAARRPTSRRRFLAGAAVTIGLPWLESLAGGGRAAYAAPPSRPVRFIAWHFPNGVYAQNWFPATAGTSYTLSTSLMPLAPLQKKLLVFSGLQNNDSSVVFGSHGLGVSGMLTCTLGTKPGIRVGISADQVYAQSLGNATRIPTGLQLGISNRMYADIGNPSIYNGCVSWASATQPLQPQIQPGVVFDQIFQGQNANASAADQMRRKTLSTSVLDHAVAEATSLQQKLGTTDRHKLDEYLTSVRSVETQIQSAASAAACSAAGMTKPANTGLDGPTQSKITSDLMVLAMQCDATRVISFMLGNGGSSCFQSFPWLNISQDHHGLAHGQNGPLLTQIDTWEVQQVAYFCQKLDAIDEGGTTMLDNSLVFVSSELGNGNRHDQANKPILVLGSAAGKIKVGQHLKFTNNEAQADLMIALLNALGVPATTFGLKQGPGQATCTTCGPAGTMPLPGVL